MEQKEVKIIGLKLNQQMGILQSCKLKFNPENRLIPIIGEVGSGKTTLQKSLMLGTLGSDTLRSDKQLYGQIDEEVQLLDGNSKIFVGCKSTKDGGLNYVIYTKDSNGNIEKEPVIDGVKLTPATYLKNLQTKLTWRIDELTSENSTIQKKILLELYKSELADIGVVFDKKSNLYVDSILGQIELAENERSIKEFERKKVGGLLNQLEPLGIDPENPSTYPEKVNIEELESKKTKLLYQKENISETRNNKLSEIKNQADSIVLKIKEENNFIEKENQLLEKEYEDKKSKYSQNTHTLNGVYTDIDTLLKEDCISSEKADQLKDILKRSFKNIELTTKSRKPKVEFDLDGRIVSRSVDFEGSLEVKNLILSYELKKREYIDLKNKPLDDNSDIEKELDHIYNQIVLANDNNHKLKMLNSYLEWKDANTKVIELRDRYSSMLKGINTGVEGLEICVDEKEIYLTYNGFYDREYFNNPNLEQRKLSSYSGTQKPIVCLLLQAYLLSKKPKALRYLWIDNVPIDNKTKFLLEKMGEELGVTIIVNITGDFTKDSINNGEILIDGGEVFFK
ncbi:MAG: hypothetical protein ACPGSO_02865 [Vicingaceae bacterium]